MSAKTAACLLASIFLAGPARGQLPGPETITRTRVIELAMERAPGVLDADTRILESRGRLAGARVLAGNPTLEAITGGPEGGDRRTELEFSMPVGFGFRRARRTSFAKAELERDEFLARDARRLAVGAALEAWYRVLHADRRLDVARERLALALRLTDAIRERLNSGDVARLDFNVAETELSRSRSEIPVEEQNLTRARADLALILGLPAVSGWDVDGDLADRSLFEAAVEDTTLNDRPDLRAAGSRLKAAEAEHAVAGTAVIPELAFRLNVIREGSVTEWLPGLAVSIPLFDRGQGLRVETNARKERARVDLERQRGAARSEREAATLLYRAAVTTVRELEDLALPRALEVENMVEQSYLSGKTDLGSMLVLRRETLETRRDYVDRLLDAALRGVEVGLSLGLWP